jgi:gas vesicle protein
MKTSERILWFAIGASIGAGIALLYAPKAGRDTRRYLRRKAEDARETVVDAGEELRERVADVGETLLDRGRGVYRRAASAAEDAAGLFDAGRRKIKL